MVFQGEDVALTKDILRPSPKEFQANESEWSAKNRDQIILTRSSAGIFRTNSSTEEFFITSASISSSIAAAGNPQFHIQVGNVNGFILSCSITGLLGVSSQNSNSLNFSSPIRVKSGETIELIKTGGAGGSVTASVIGWEEGKKIV